MRKLIRKIKNLPLETKTLLCIATMFITFFCWSLLAQVDQVVRGQGVIVSAEKAHDIQTDTLTKIMKINVSLGDTVHKGDILVILDSASITLQLEQDNNSLMLAKARLDRLTAELKEIKITYSSDTNSDIRLAQENIWRANLSSRKNRALSIKSKLSSHSEEHNNVKKRLALKTESAKLLDAKILSVSTLLAQGAIPEMTLLDLQRERISLEEDILAHRTKSKSLLSGIEIIKYETDQYNDEIKANLETDALVAQERIQHLLGEINKGKNELNLTKLLAPIDGVVSNIDVHTGGRVIRAGERILEVTPVSNRFKVELKVQPKDAAHIRKGSKARVKLSAYNYSQYGYLQATVITMAGNTVIESLDAPYFRVLMQIDSIKFSKKDTELATIIPGMVCSVEILGDKKSIFEYLISPFRQIAQSAFTQ